MSGLPAGDCVFEADGKTLRNLWRMEQHSPFFRDFDKRPDITALAGRLVHGSPVLHGVETFNKPAKIGSAVPPHQDNAYFCMDPPDMLTIWIALDAATLDNGPIYYVKGSHRHGVAPHQKSGVQGNSMGLVDPPRPSATNEEILVGTLRPGDALIHHCQTIHYSSPNHSDRSRCGLLAVYHGEHTRQMSFAEGRVRTGRSSAQSVQAV